MSLTKGIARTFLCGRDVFEGQELHKEGEDVEGCRNVCYSNCVTCINIEDGQILKSFNWDRLLSEIIAVSCFV